MINTDDCWHYAGSNNGNGYGLVFGNKNSYYAHRVMYENTIGDIPKGLQIDHLCMVRCCINPKHLEPVTRRENILRGNGMGAQMARKTHCINGHEFTGKNLILLKQGHRKCRACWKKYLNNYRKSKV